MFSQARPPQERLRYRQPTGLNPLYHRDDDVDRPRAMGIWIPFPRLPYVFLPSDNSTPYISRQSLSRCQRGARSPFTKGKVVFDTARTPQTKFAPLLQTMRALYPALATPPALSLQRPLITPRITPLINPLTTENHLTLSHLSPGRRNSRPCSKRCGRCTPRWPRHPP